MYMYIHVYVLIGNYSTINCQQHTILVVIVTSGVAQFTQKLSELL